MQTSAEQVYLICLPLLESVKKKPHMEAMQRPKT